MLTFIIVNMLVPSSALHFYTMGIWRKQNRHLLVYENLLFIQFNQGTINWKRVIELLSVQI